MGQAGQWVGSTIVVVYRLRTCPAMTIHYAWERMAARPLAHRSIDHRRSHDDANRNLQ